MTIQVIADNIHIIDFPIGGKAKAQNRFQDLKRKFASEHRLLEKVPSGSGLDDTNISDWPLYDELKFLSSFVDNPEYVELVIKLTLLLSYSRRTSSLTELDPELQLEKDVSELLSKNGVSPAVKRSKISSSEERDNSFLEGLGSIAKSIVLDSKEEDEFDLFGRKVSLDLKKLPEDIREETVVEMEILLLNKKKMAREQSGKKKIVIFD